MDYNGFNGCAGFNDYVDYNDSGCLVIYLNVSMVIILYSIFPTPLS